jgi:signal transduction histidine kinase
LASIIEKRRNLHKQVLRQEKENKHLQFQLGRLQALANIGINTSMIAHEINNLLTPLSNYAELAIKNRQDNALAEKALQKTVGNCRRASKVMESILAMANKNEAKQSEINLKNIVEEIFNCLCRDFSKDSIAVKIDIPENLIINGIEIQIQQVIMNLILNAREAMLESGGTLTIKGRQQNEEILIEVSDTGCGIRPEDLNKIFEPFFTTKNVTDCDGKQGGSGLGLAFCQKVIDSHNGTISVSSQFGKTTTFKITLPLPK